MKLADIMNQMVQTYIYRTFYLNTKEYTFSSAPHGTLSKTVLILTHKTSFNKYKKIEIAPCMLSGHYRVELNFNNDRNNRKINN